MGRLPVTAVITSYNEIEFIEGCVGSVLWADEVLLVDSFSTDGTVELVRQKFPKVRIEQREYLGSASQKNWGIDQASHDWILMVDSDEKVTPGLRDEVLRKLETTPELWGYSIGRANFMLGRPVRYSGLQRDKVTRFFHREHARYPNRRVHTDLRVEGEVGRLEHKFEHYYIRSFDHMIEKMTRYATWGATQLFIEGRRTSGFQIFGHAAAKFVRDYIVNLGFLDGVPGLISVGMHVYYTFWKYAKLWEFRRLERLGRPIPLAKVDEDDSTWTPPWEKRAKS
jgi:glycosyltransferase involved in cell wall biosynthesis